MLRENYRKRECLLLGEKGKKQYYRMYPAGHNSKIHLGEGLQNLILFLVGLI